MQNFTRVNNEFRIIEFLHTGSKAWWVYLGWGLWSSEVAHDGVEKLGFTLDVLVCTTQGKNYNSFWDRPNEKKGRQVGFIFIKTFPTCVVNMFHLWGIWVPMSGFLIITKFLIQCMTDQFFILYIAILCKILKAVGRIRDFFFLNIYFWNTQKKLLVQIKFKIMIVYIFLKKS